MTPLLFCNFHETLSTLKNSILSIAINFPKTEITPLNNMVMMLTVRDLGTKKQPIKHKSSFKRLFDSTDQNS